MQIKKKVVKQVDLILIFKYPLPTKDGRSYVRLVLTVKIKLIFITQPSYIHLYIHKDRLVKF